jgi:protoheme IX farnesyltransferase
MRLGVSLTVSFSAATGYLVANSFFDIEIIFVILGVLLLAGGASALNQYQERSIDALMSRTKNRPIPSGKISATTGLLIAIILCLLGLIVLYTKTGLTPALLGLLNLLWYNGFYTYLKKKTAFAVVPGSLTGVTPLLIGWSATGAYLLNPEIIIISFFIFMWQIPHFWILHIRYSNDYKNAGLGSLRQLFSDNRIKRIIFIWIFATSLTSLLLPYFGIIQSKISIGLVLIINIWIIVSIFRTIFKTTDSFDTKKAFIEINAFMLLIMSILILESILI